MNYSFTAEPKEDAATFSTVVMDSLSLEVEIAFQNVLKNKCLGETFVRKGRKKNVEER